MPSFAPSPKAPLSTAVPASISEGRIILVLAMVQFINILDFMMVMPLGPDFAKALQVAPSNLGIVGGCYTAAAAISGLIVSRFLDRFDRKKALIFAMVGLALGTFAGALAINFTTLVMARIFAGIFGGPATSLTMAIVSDVVPAERRGKAFGQLMSSFSLASVFGVPAGLEIARLGNWQSPFYAVGSLGCLVALLAFMWLPNFTAHLQSASKKGSTLPLRVLLARPEVLVSYIMTATVMMGSFLIIPNIAAFIQYNLGYPRDRIGGLYMLGGIANFITMFLAGWLTDKKGALLVAVLGSVGVVASMYFGFAEHAVWMTPPLIFIGFMASTSLRNVSYNTVCSKIPQPEERAGYLSIQSAVQHFSIAAGALVSTQLLSSAPDGQLLGIGLLSWIAIIITVTLPFFMASIIRMQKLVNEVRPAI